MNDWTTGNGPRYELAGRIAIALSEYLEDSADHFALAEYILDEVPMVPLDWHGLIGILDTVYPEKTFPTLPDSTERDQGPRIVSLCRRLDDARKKLEATA